MGTAIFVLASLGIPHPPSSDAPRHAEWYYAAAVGVLALLAPPLIRRRGDLFPRRQAQAPNAISLLEASISGFSARLIHAAPDDLDAEIESTLGAIGRLMHVDHSLAILLADDGTHISHVYEWCAPGLVRKGADLVGLTVAPFQWSIAQLSRLEPLQVPDVAALAREAAPEQAHWLARSIRSVLGLPMADGSAIMGLLAVNMESTTRTWSADEVRQFRVIAEILTNVLARRRIECALRSSESRLKIILDTVQTGIITVEAETHRIVDANPAALQMIGAPRDRVLGAVCHQFICPAEYGHCPICDLGQSIDNSERVLLTADGQRLPVIKTVARVTLDGRLNLVESFVNISDRKKTEDELTYLSTHDALTGLYNRLHFEQVKLQLQGSVQFPISIVMADVDGLKHTNDNQGHGAGDRLLQNAARILKAGFRAGDIVARIGGDEFAILLPHSNSYVAEQALSRVRTCLLAHNADQDDYLSLSFGVATATADTSLAEALKRADQRMYEEKLAKARLRGA